MEFTHLIDLAGERLGGAVIASNDEFFAPKEALIKASAPEWREGEYTERGKWMDGWETRRRREAGYDWCIVRLGLPGRVHGVVVDTSFFTGNFPESCSIDAITAARGDSAASLAESTAWREVLPRTALVGNASNAFEIDEKERVTHLRLNIFPDGGVARLRVHGVVLPEWNRIAKRGGEVDLAAVENGGSVVLCSDMHYGNPQNMLYPGPSLGMHDGWETKRRRGPGHDWSVVRLGARGVIKRVVIDTSHFKGNAPGACWLEICEAGGTPVPRDTIEWEPLLDRQPLQPHTVHEFESELRSAGPGTHVRLSIEPDGGVARLRLFGRRTDD